MADRTPDATPTATPRPTRAYRLHARTLRQQAVQAVAAGASITATANRFGLALSGLQVWCRQAGVRSRHHRFPDRAYRTLRDRYTTEAQRQQALAAVANGASFAAAGRAIGVTGAAVSRWWHARSEDAA